MTSPTPALTPAGWLIVLAFEPLGLLSVNAVREAGAIGVVAAAAWRRRRRRATANPPRTAGRAHG